MHKVSRVASPATYVAQKVRQAVGLVGTGFLFVYVMTANAFALTGIGQLAQQDDQTQAQPLLTAILDVAFVAGAVLIITSIFTAIKANKSKGNEAKMSTAALLFFAGAALSVVSYLMGVGVGTIFSGGGIASQGVVPMQVN